MGHCGNVAAVIARSEATKQSRGTGLNLSNLAPDPLDCFAVLAKTISGVAVSYTHLDVYKRQTLFGGLVTMPTLAGTTVVTLG